MLRTLTATSPKSVLPYGLARTRHFTALCPQTTTAQISAVVMWARSPPRGALGTTQHAQPPAGLFGTAWPGSHLCQPGTGDREILFSDSWTLTHTGFLFLTQLPFVNLEIMAKVSESLLHDGLSITQARTLPGACWQRTLLRSLMESYFQEPYNFLTFFLAC